MSELIFNGMDIPQEVSKLLKTIVNQVCNGMNESEKTAFNLGVGNTMAILRTLLEINEPVVHIPNLDVIEEMDVKELEEIFLK